MQGRDDIVNAVDRAVNEETDSVEKRISKLFSGRLINESYTSYS